MQKMLSGCPLNNAADHRGTRNLLEETSTSGKVTNDWKIPMVDFGNANICNQIKTGDSTLQFDAETHKQRSARLKVENVVKNLYSNDNNTKTC